MSEEQAEIIQKKLESPKQISSPLPRLNDILGVFTRNVEKNARNYIGCVVEAMILESEIKKFSDVLDGVSMPAMIGIIQTDGVDRSAMVNLDLDLTYHIVDLKMGGLPTELPEFVARRPTPIDCNLVTPLVNIALKGWIDAIEDLFSVPDIGEMRCSNFEHLPMMAAIVPDHSDVLFIRVVLDIGEAARSGNFDLVIPLSSLDRIKAKLQKTFTIGADSKGDAWAEHMMSVILDTELEMNPVIHKTQLSVAELSRMEVGQVLPLDAGAHNAVRLYLEGDEEPLTQGKLGKWKSDKALKLLDAPDGAFLGPLRDLIAEAAADVEADAQADSSS